MRIQGEKRNKEEGKKRMEKQGRGTKWEGRIRETGRRKERRQRKGDKTSSSDNNSKNNSQYLKPDAGRDHQTEEPDGGKEKERKER